MKNIIYIVCDQLRAQALSCYGETNINTPNIDRLSYEGVKFTNAIASTPLCCPARGTMITGKYNNNHSVKGHEYQLKGYDRLLTDEFNDNGYKTIYLGKWHLDGFNESDGRAAIHFIPKKRRGNFKTWIGYENNNSPFDFYLHGHDGEEEILMHNIKKYETDYITDLSIDMIRKYKNEKMFMWINFQAPHNPYIAPAKYKEIIPSKIELRDNVPKGGNYEIEARNDLSGYYAMIKNIDENVGRILNELIELNLIEDTHIIFTSDHGDMHGSNGQFKKTTYYHESLNVPFIIGGGVPFDYKYKSGDIDYPLGQFDIAPTLLGLAEIEIPVYFEGYNFSNARMNGELVNPPDATLFGLYKETGHWDSLGRTFRGVYTIDKFKYIVFKEMPIAMYDLDSDPYEQANLIWNTKYEHIRCKLHSKYVDLLQSCNDMEYLHDESCKY